jgi:hypothetical protein
VSISPELVVLRLVGDVVLDHPFASQVPLPLWAATLDEDGSDPSGWRRTMWLPVFGRGWAPQVLHYGDVIEFGSWAASDWRWFGWYTHHGDEAIIVTGPYPSPGDALVDAAEARREVAERTLSDYQRTRLDVAASETSSAGKIEPRNPAR